MPRGDGTGPRGMGPQTRLRFGKLQTSGTNRTTAKQRNRNKNRGNRAV